LDILVLKGGFSPDGAEKFLRVYDATIAFAGLSKSDKTAMDNRGGEGGRIDEEGEDDDLPPPPEVKIGDYVQWTSGGIDQFKVPRRVLGFFDESHAQVFGSNTGIPVTELTVVQSPEAASPSSPPAEASRVESNSASTQGENDFTVLQRGNRLQITADVDLDGIATLKAMLDDYESILRRLSGRKIVARQHPALSGPDEGHLSTSPSSQPNVTDWQTRGKQD
jgi:hypothetical protein